jgi:hypothetical protein
MSRNHLRLSDPKLLTLKTVSGKRLPIQDISPEPLVGEMDLRLARLLSMTFDILNNFVARAINDSGTGFRLSLSMDSN